MSAASKTGDDPKSQPHTTESKTSPPSKTTDKKPKPARSAKPPKGRGVGLRTALALSVIAALIGVAGGAGLSHVMRPDMPEPDLSAVDAALDSLRSDQGEVTARLGRIEQSQRALTARKPPAAVDLSPLQSRVQRLETRFETLAAIDDAQDGEGDS